MTPLIDVVFILLLFFLVSSTFIRETGVEVSRPTSATGSSIEPEAIRIVIAESGNVYFEGNRMTLERLEDTLSGRLRARPDSLVVIVPDESVNAGRLIAVLDRARLSGAKDVAVATEAEGAP
jgi:biopolymer transport protein ExbD